MVLSEVRNRQLRRKKGLKLQVLVILMKMMIKLLLCFVLVFAASSAFAAAEPSNALLKRVTDAASGATVKNYPDSDTVLLYNVENLEFK